MYAIAGATGRIGSRAAATLLDEGVGVRVLVRREADADAFRARGAEARTLSLGDGGALSNAVEGCDGLFVLLPFDLTVDDLGAHADGLISSIVGGVVGQRVAHVVMLSSGGADLAEGTGPIVGLHRLEQSLLATGTILTALRPGHFQEKVADTIDVVRETGVYSVFAASADVAHPMVATRDIGAIVARSLQSPPASSEAVDIVGPSYSERDVANALGRAMGRELHVVPLAEESWADALTGAGFRPHIAASLSELYRADERGLLAPRGDRSIHASTSIGETIDRVLAAR